jgi:hypothetical protein
MVASRHGGQGLVGIGCLTAKMKVFLKVEKQGHAFSDNGVVIDHQDAGLAMPSAVVVVHFSLFAG